MKLILAIVHNDDGPLVSSSLTKAGFHVTKIASTGGFLMNGNTTFLIGVEDHLVDSAIEIISNYSKRRTQPIINDSMASTGNINPNAMLNVQVGGGTILVLNVERFERV